MSQVLADIVAKVGEERLGRNNRIGRSKFLNQPCVSRADLESMLLRRTPKIFLQQYRADPEVPIPGPGGSAYSDVLCQAPYPRLGRLHAPV